MEPIVVDASVIVAFFLEAEEYHQRSRTYVDGLEHGAHIFHLPMLVVIEVASAISRRAGINTVAILTAWQQNVVDWEQDGKLVLYPLDRGRMNSAGDVAVRHGLRGADSVIVGLAEELGFSLRTFDREIIARFQQASP